MDIMKENQFANRQLQDERSKWIVDEDSMNYDHI